MIREANAAEVRIDLEEIAQKIIEKAQALYGSSHLGNDWDNQARIKEALKKGLDQNPFFLHNHNSILFILPDSSSFEEISNSVKILGKSVLISKIDFDSIELRDRQKYGSVLVGHITGFEMEGFFTRKAGVDELTLRETLATLVEHPQFVTDCRILHTATQCFKKATGELIGTIGIRWICDGRQQCTELFVEPARQDRPGIGTGLTGRRITI